MLILFVCVVSFLSLIIFIREIKVVYLYKTNKPNKVKDCYFSSEQKHKETGVIESLKCTNPNSPLNTIPPKQNCASSCKISLNSNDNISFDHAIKLSSPIDLILIESFKLSASIIPTIIAVIKLTEK